MLRVNTKKEVYQENDILYNNRGEALTKYKNIEVPFTPHSLKKINKPKKLRISLGQKCNYNCKYCLQDSLSEKTTYKNIDKTVLSKLDLSNLERIELWGGEPLIYWHYIKDIISAVDKPTIEWMIVTNGSLLEEHHVDYLENLKGKLILTMSHDGPAQVKLRGEDVLPQKAKLLKRLQKFAKVSFNTIITNQNFDLFEIEDYFKSYNINNNYELAEAYGYDSIPYVVQGENLEKYDQILRSYLVNSEHSNSFKQDLREQIKFSMNPHKRVTSTRCGIDCEDFLTIDLEGNIKPCQNVGKDYISGNIEDFNKVNLKHVKFNGLNRCNTCEVNSLCMSSCPLVQDINLFNINCAINKVHYKAIQDIAYQILFQEIKI